ncbi:MAG TPA: tRNA (N6-isopentenyl adenosine(37)-C2)-methylthiotransferase MiaB [Fimbriimonadaceae bacterium]
MPDATLIRPENLARNPRSQTVRGTYFVQTWGCQMNEEDSEQLGLSLENIGFQRALDMQSAQVILLNTCSVRKKPEDKAFSMLGELVPLKKMRPEVIIGVCGCMAQIRADEIKRRAPHVDIVLGTGQISRISGLVEEVIASRDFVKDLDLPERKGSVVTDIPQRNVGREAKLKAFVPIQYGCDKFCTFCIVPTTRGRERSRPTEHILEEVTTLVATGTREVTLLGQTVNSYGKNLLEGRVPFSQLLWKLAEISGLQRIRYTSPYPRDFKQDLLETIRDCPVVMEHVHLPLQSGNDEVLKAMKRLYSRTSFLEIVAALRATIPGVAITTDIIVGFPGETEEQFEDTLSLVESVGFDASFMFVYSPRPGTPAADMEQVPFDVRQGRIHRLVELQHAVTCKVNSCYVGRELEVLVEGPSYKTASKLQGQSREAKLVLFEGPADLVGQIVPIRVVQSHLWGLSGELI